MVLAQGDDDRRRVGATRTRLTGGDMKTYEVADESC